MVSLADVLDAQAVVESGGNPTARSYKNARGLHQFMPATWRQYGRGKDINDPVANRDAAARYLTDLYKKHGSLPLALAAYNGGDKGAEYLARNPQFMHHPDKSAPINTWRHQTGDYVNKIMTALDRMSPIRSANAAEDENPEANDYAQTDDPITNNEPERTQRTQQPEIDDWQEMPPSVNHSAEIDDWQEVAPTQQNQTQNEKPEYQVGNTVAGDVGHGAGVTARSLIEGAAGLPASIYNMAQIIPNYIQEKTGFQAPIQAPKSINTEQYGTSLADYIGLPKANENEQFNQQLSKGLGGFVIPAAAMTKFGKAGGVVEGIGKFMGGENPLTLSAGITGGAVAQEVAREMDASPNQQLAANIAGNVAGGGLAGVMNMAGRTTARTTNALLNRNEGVAGRVLNRAAGDQAQRVIADLESGVVPSIQGKMIKAYQPTSSEIAGNAGVSSILRQAGLDPDTATVLADRQFQNSKAVKDYIEKQAVGSEAYRTAKDQKLWEQVDKVSKPMRQRDLPVDLTPVETAIDAAILKNKGNPAIIAGLEKLKSHIPQGGTAGFNETYNYKQWIDESLRAKNMVDPEIMSLQKAKSAMGDIKTALADTMTATEPEFKDFLANQAKGVTDLKRRSLAEKIVEAKSSRTPRVSNTATGQEELYPLTGAALKSVTKNPKVMAELSPYQRKVFEKAQQHAALEGRDQLGTMVGSNTAQHLNIRDVVAQDIIAAIVGEGKGSEKLGKAVGTLANMLPGTSGFIKARTMSPSGVANILAKAKLDPAYAAQLMKTYGLDGKNFNDSLTQATLRGLMTGQAKPKGK